MKEIDTITKFYIMSNIDRIESLLNTGILSETRNIFFKSTLIEILILMRDLTKKSELYLNKNIDFKDNITIDEDLKIYNVSDLIRVFRDCFCHIETNKKKVGNSTFDYNIIENNGIISVNMGKHFLLINEHLIRSFNQVKTNFSQI